VIFSYAGLQRSLINRLSGKTVGWGSTSIFSYCSWV